MPGSEGMVTEREVDQYVPEFESPFAIVILGWLQNRLSYVLSKLELVDLGILHSEAQSHEPGTVWRDEILPAVSRCLGAREAKRKPLPRAGVSIFEQVKTAVRIEEFTARFTLLEPAGADRLRGCCPIHQEKTPSFHVFTDSQRWWCYGACAGGGDLIVLAQKLIDVGKL